MLSTGHPTIQESIEADGNPVQEALLGNGENTNGVDAAPCVLQMPTLTELAVPTIASLSPGISLECPKRCQGYLATHF